MPVVRYFLVKGGYAAPLREPRLVVVGKFEAGYVLGGRHCFGLASQL